MSKKTNDILNPPVRKENPYLIYGLYLLFFVLLIFLTITKISGEDDFFWHLETGKYIIENKTIPSADVFGYISMGQKWFPFEWGWDVVTYIIFNAAGYAGIYVFRTLLILLTFSILLKLLIKLKINHSLNIIFLMIFCWGIMCRFSIRPHLVSYLFFTIIIYILTSYRYIDRNNYRILYYLPPVFLIWANFHMGVVAGAILLGIFLFSETVIFFRPKTFSSKEIPPLTKKELLRFAGIFGLTLAAMLINPNHINTYIYVYDHTHLKLLNDIGEWQSPFSAAFSASPAMITYKIMLVLGVLVLYYSYKKKDIYSFLVLAVFAVYSMRAARLTTDYNIIVSVFIFLAINYFVTKAKSDEVRNFIYNNIGFKVILAGLLVFQIVSVQNDKLFNVYFDYYRKWGIGTDSKFIPQAMLYFARDTKLSAPENRVFNTLSCGGMYIWTFPGNKNFIDSRNLNDQVYSEYDNIYSIKPGFADKIKNYNIDYFMILLPDMAEQPQMLNKIIVSYLSRTGDEWKLVYWDDVSLVYVKNIPKFEQVISKYEYKYISPFNFLFNKKLIDRGFAEDKQTISNEMKRKLNEEPAGVIINFISKSYGLK